MLVNTESIIWHLNVRRHDLLFSLLSYFIVYTASTTDPAKAAQQRINVRHIADPYLKGTKTGGPHSMIHKHSRAIAFSIFRSYSLFQSKHGGSSIHTSEGIMLAPKKVQEQYISTKMTSMLSTHGLLMDLKDSFREVGLLHMQPHKSGAKDSVKKRTGYNIFDYVPEDSPYMLLPLWAGETDSSMSSSLATQAPTLSTIPEDREYLLVWYVPNEDAKQSHSTLDGTGDTHEKNIYLRNFYVNVLVVQYDALHGMGVRVPSDGLAIMGPVRDVVSYGMDVGWADTMEMSVTTICVCSSREKGFQFLPEGLRKLGLCSQEDEYEQGNMELLLTPIGRAAVEMVWLGCLAMTSFGPGLNCI